MEQIPRKRKYCIPIKTIKDEPIDLEDKIKERKS